MQMAHPAAFAVTEAPSGREDVQLLVCAGEIDIATVPSLVEAFTRVTARRLVVSLSDVTFLGSDGVAALLRVSKEANVECFALCCPSGPVRRCLEVLGMEARLGVCEALEDAIERVSGPTG